MMSVEEYALDVNKTVEEILKYCEQLGIKVSSKDDMLDDEAITELDSEIANNISEEELEDELEDRVEEIILEKNINVDNTIKKQKLNKKKDININKKKEFANKKKQMYKNKEKLISNTPNKNDNVVLYKEGMTIGELAKAIGIMPSELIKKLFVQGIMVTINNSISYENAEISRHISNQISQKSVDSLIASAQKHFNLVSQFYKRKKR